MKHYGLLAILFLFSSTIHAANCTPEVTGKKVIVEYFDGDGNLIRSETHRVRSKKKYKGLVSNEKAFKKLKKDKTGNVKVRSGKLDLKSGGMTTKVSKKDGTVLAMVGGCPVSKLKFYEKVGSKKKPFIHTSLIKLASKAKVKTATAAAKSNSATAELQKSERVKRRLASEEAASSATSVQAAAQPAKQAAIQPTANTNKKRKSSLYQESSSGKPWKGISEPLNDVYGWIHSTHMGRLGLDYKNIYQTVSLGPSSFSLSGQKSFCMVMHYDQLVPLESQELVDDKKLTTELKKIEALGDGLVKFNNVRLIDVGFVKGQNCVFSSVTKAEYPPKTSAFFTLNENAGEFLKYNVVRDSGRLYFPKGFFYNFNDPEASTVRFENAHLLCGSGIAWSSSKNFKAMKKRVESGEFDNINAAEIEFQGMALSTYQQMMCEVDNIKVKKLS